MATRLAPFSACAISGYQVDILHPPDLQSWVGKGSEGRLGSRSRGLGSISSCGLKFDVKGSDAQLLTPLVYILGSQHSSVERGLILVILHLHPPVTQQMVSLPGRLVTWTKVSLGEAKMWQTPNTFFPSAMWGSRLMACSSFFPSPCNVPFLHVFSRFCHWKGKVVIFLVDIGSFCSSVIVIHNSV